ncbi:uncharacterized protein LOC128951893 [Oppia nitens]|uniref:uncharacterized protein LOC128951893 n=1 Tax=Oppia nitens TaxID=1686743 RepID=UPI0023DBCCBB|nr:uncharacterized protein LOC128951893 [Oppia nitens]
MITFGSNSLLLDNDNQWHHLDSKLSQKRYKTAFTVYRKKDIKPNLIYGFLRSEKPVIDWFEINGDNNTLHLNQRKLLNTTKWDITFGTSFDPSFSVSLFNYITVCFYSQRQEKDRFIGKWKCFDFSNIQTPREVTNEIVHKMKPESGIPRFISNGVYTEHRLIMITGSGYSNGFNLYFIENSIISSCQTSENGFKSFACNSGINKNIEIDCRLDAKPMAYEFSENPRKEAVANNKSWLPLIIAILIIGLVIVAVIALISYLIGVARSNGTKKCSKDNNRLTVSRKRSRPKK